MERVAHVSGRGNRGGGKLRPGLSAILEAMAFDALGVLFARLESETRQVVSLAAHRAAVRALKAC